MGKIFKKELEQMYDTVQWAEQQNVTILRSFFISESQQLPLISIGSGGSLSACSYASLLYQQKQGLAMSMTPLAFDYSTAAAIKDSKLLYISASGRNNDFLIAFKRGLQADRKGIASFSLRESDKLNKAVEKAGDDYKKILYPLPNVKDGFLATNSLIAFFVLLYKSFYDTNISEYLNTDGGFSKNSDFNFSEIENYIVLYSNLSQPVAVDLESKFSEAALGAILLADYRNFAHGRHQWFKNRGGNSCIIALVNKKDAPLAEKTLEKLPGGINIVYIETKLGTPAAAIDLLIKSFKLVQVVGEAKGIDPGRPHVADYGKELYHLSYTKLLP